MRSQGDLQQARPHVQGLLLRVGAVCMCIMLLVRKKWQCKHMNRLVSRVLELMLCACMDAVCMYGCCVHVWMLCACMDAVCMYGLTSGILRMQEAFVTDRVCLHGFVCVSAHGDVLVHACIQLGLVSMYCV
jgi:hypothetical protein